MAGIGGHVGHSKTVYHIAVTAHPRPVFMVVIDGITDPRSPIGGLLLLQAVFLDEVLLNVGKGGFKQRGISHQLLQFLTGGSNEGVDILGLADEGDGGTAEI